MGGHRRVVVEQLPPNNVRNAGSPLASQCFSDGKRVRGKGNQRERVQTWDGSGSEGARVVSRAVVEVFSGTGKVEVFLPRKESC